MTLIGQFIGPADTVDAVAAIARKHLPFLTVVRADNPSSLEPMSDGDHLVFIAMVVDNGELSAGRFTPLIERYPHTRIVVLTHERQLTDVASLVDQSKIDLIVYLPDYRESQVVTNLERQVRRYCGIVGIDSPVPNPELDRFIFSLPLSDSEILDQIVSAIDETLGYQPRIRIPAGVRLTQENTSVEEATLAISGRISLERESHAGNVLMHHASTGQVIGLLSMASQQPAFFTSRTTTEVTGINLTFEQLNDVIEQHPDTFLLISSLFIRSLERRLRRAEDIQLEKVVLTAKLQEEQAKLREALKKLEDARAQLITQARFASLGELAAGVAHELNNPMAAISRTADHLSHDVARLLGTGEPSWARRSLDAMTAAHDAPSISTREARELKREMQKVTSTPEIASRLVRAGIRNPDIMHGVRDEDDVVALETAASIGTGLRNLESASERITGLVASLRSYARPDGDPVGNVNVHSSLDDTIRLLNHKLENVDLVRNYGDIPEISAHPGQLAQVWTNLMSNSAEALETTDRRGTIEVATENAYPGWIRVKIIDNGPGIDPDLIERIFEPRFTTKAGQVRYGMGIGLGLAKSIVDKHHGIIRFSSSPAGTTAIVELPVEAL